MLRKYWLHLLQLDGWALTAVLLLATFGLAMLGSIEYNADEISSGRFFKQLIFFAVSVLALLFVSYLDYRWLRNYANIFYFLGILLLILVLIFGTTINGTRGWFAFGSLTFQPVELVKLCMIIFLSHWFTEKGGEFYKFKNILFSVGLVGVIIGLVLLQPDLGSALIILVIWLGLLCLVRTKKRYILYIILSLILVGVCAWFFVLKDYQKDRLLTFIDPNRDPLVTGYNLSQSLIAVGSGKIWGRGLGLGPQSQLNFLPEQENDFIFAAISEELGFFGAGVIIGLFMLFFYRTLIMLKKSPDDFSLFMLAGILFAFFGQFFINIGMNIGIMPITGLPLPFVSSGGSSLLISFCSVGLIQSIRVHGK